MNSTAINRVVGFYGLKVSKIMPMQSGYRNKNYPLLLANGDTANLIVYKREPNILNTIKQASYIGNYLHARGFPARYSYDSRILRLTKTPPRQFAAVYAYLPGKTIPWEAYTMVHIKALGKTLSDMHSLLKGLDDADLPLIHGVYADTLNRMQQYFGDSDVFKAMANKLNYQLISGWDDDYSLLIKIAEYLPNQQPIHMDFVRSNILFEDDSPIISGVIDFEKAALGAPVFDIARTLAFLLVDCKYKTEAQVRKYFLESGYNKYGNAQFKPLMVKISGVKINILEQAIDLFLMYDFYKFLRHNPYEFLDQNEHFVRTANLLLARGVIKNI